MYEELYHHGVKGMKWGVRRDRNNTSVGTTGGSNKKSVDYDYKSAKKQVDAAEKIVSTAKGKRNENIKRQTNAKIKSDLSKMSDDELRQVVNRLNMEERYTQVMQSRGMDTGKNRVDRILDYAGTAITIGSSALSIMVAINELKK